MTRHERSAKDMFLLCQTFWLGGKYFIHGREQCTDPSVPWSGRSSNVRFPTCFALSLQFLTLCFDLGVTGLPCPGLPTRGILFALKFWSGRFPARHQETVTVDNSDHELSLEMRRCSIRWESAREVLIIALDDEGAARLGMMQRWERWRGD